MAHHAFSLRVVLNRIDAGDFAAVAVGIQEPRMAAEAEFSGAVDVIADRVFRVVVVGAVAIFAAYDAVGRVFEVGVLPGVTFLATGSGLVFDRHLLPNLFVGFAMPAVHVAALVAAEIFRDNRASYQQGYSQQA